MKKLFIHQHHRESIAAFVIFEDCAKVWMQSCDTIEMSKHMIYDKRRVLKAQYILDQCNIKYRVCESCAK